MIVEFTEVFEINTGTTTLQERKRQFSLREIYINPDHVVCLRPDNGMTAHMEAGLLPRNLKPGHEFTKIHLDRGHSGIDVVVVGTPSVVEGKLRAHKRELLKG